MKNRIFNFLDFINEADFRENPAVTKEYLNSLDQRGQKRADDLGRKYGREMVQLMSFVWEVKRIQSGKEEKLEKLAHKVMLNEFEDILGGTQMIFKIPIDEKIELPKPEECKKCKIPNWKEIKDNDVINAIHKRKILNMVAQGEALNAKKIFLNPLSERGIFFIFGREEGKKYLDLLVKISDIASALDWNIPEEIQKEMWEQGDSFAGFSKIEWEPEKEKKKEEEEEEEEKYPDEESIEGATIHAVGLDYAMLIHEGLKGIWGLINQAGMAHLAEPDIEKVFTNADTIEDEIQDLKRANLTTGDLRDFLNSFPDLSYLKNGRAYIWGKMISSEVLSDKEFLHVMKLIWESSPLYNKDKEYSEEEKRKAKKAMDEVRPLIDGIIKDTLREYKNWAAEAAYYDMDIENQVGDSEEMELNLDDILDKISDVGFENLTPMEKNFLDNIK